jgi:hypothetical protein
MTPWVDEGLPAKGNWRSGLRSGLIEGAGALQQTLGALVATVGLFFYGEMLMLWFVLPLGCAARLLACARTWRAPGRAYFLAAALLGLCATIGGAFLVFAGVAQRYAAQAERLRLDDIQLQTFLMGTPRPEVLVLGWFVLAVAALEGLLCIAFAAAHHRLQPRHSGRLYVSGIASLVVAALLFSLSNRAGFAPESGSTYLLTAAAALLLGIGLYRSGSTFVLIARTLQEPAGDPG